MRQLYGGLRPYTPKSVSKGGGGTQTIKGSFPEKIFQRDHRFKKESVWGYRYNVGTSNPILGGSQAFKKTV